MQSRIFNFDPKALVVVTAFGTLGAHWTSIGCTAAPAPSVAQAPTSAAPSPAAPATVEQRAAADGGACDGAACDAQEAAPPAVPPEKPKKFSLPEFAPPHERSAQPGDGQWVAVPEVGETDGQPLALRTTVRPHPFRKDVYAAIIAFDLSRTELVWVAGAKEPHPDAGAKPARQGVIPKRDQDHLLAAFNGGFLARHGRFGAMLDGHVLVPPREAACTIAMLESGAVKIAPWEELAGDASSLTNYRQTPPCLVHGGELHERIVAEPKKWGLSAEGKDEIRRSALGIDPSGRVLFFGLGEWVVPKEIAKAMKVAGAVTAAELDINWSYTRFNFYGRKTEGGPLEVTSTLIPQLVHGKRSYVADIAERDFFYIRKKR